MLDIKSIESALEKVVEELWNQKSGSENDARGGNSPENERYFKDVVPSLVTELKCQVIPVPKNKCPDSGVFGEFTFKTEKEVDWLKVEHLENIVLTLKDERIDNRFIELPIKESSLLTTLKEFYEFKGNKKKDEIKSDLTIEENKKFKKLNDDVDLGGYFKLLTKSVIPLSLQSFTYFKPKTFFGVEFKAAKNTSEKSISIPPFNSTCPSKEKVLEFNNTFFMIYQFNGKKSKCKVKLSIEFLVYYLIVNDSDSGISKIFICDGGFFSPNLSTGNATKISEELKKDVLDKIKSYNKEGADLGNVTLRYRPFFDAKSVQADGNGIYTSWKSHSKNAEEIQSGYESVSPISKIIN